MNFPLGLVNSILAFSIAFLGATLQGSIGFGLGLIGVPLLALLNPIFIPGPLLLAALSLTLLISYRERSSVSIWEIKWAVVGRIIGSILGISLLSIFPKDNMSTLFGIMVLIAVASSVSGLKLPLNSSSLLGAGVFSGLMGTTSAIGGAPMALVYQRQKGSRLRGTLSSIFVMGTIISLISLIAINRFGIEEIKVTLVLIPGIICGFLLSSHTSQRLDRGFTRPAVLIASAASGIVVLIRSFF